LAHWAPARELTLRAAPLFFNHHNKDRSSQILFDRSHALYPPEELPRFLLNERYAGGRIVNGAG
jgi:hypothetical protein